MNKKDLAITIGVFGTLILAGALIGLILESPLFWLILLTITIACAFTSGRIYEEYEPQRFNRRSR